MCINYQNTKIIYFTFHDITMSLVMTQYLVDIARAILYIVGVYDIKKT